MSEAWLCEWDGPTDHAGAIGKKSAGTVWSYEGLKLEFRSRCCNRQKSLELKLNETQFRRCAFLGIASPPAQHVSPGLEVSQHQMPLYQAVPSLCMCVTCRAYMLTWTECVLVYKSARRDVAWPHSALTRPRHHSGRDHAPSPPIRPSDPPRGAPRNHRVPAESACAHIRRPAMRGRGCRPSHRPSSALAPASR